MSEKPIMSWDSQEPFDTEGKVIWWTRLDKRYQVEVQRKGDYEGTLFLWDHERDDERIFGKAVTLPYQAIFGPDVDDVALWESIVLEFVDAIPKEAVNDHHDE